MIDLSNCFLKYSPSTDLFKVHLRKYCTPSASTSNNSKKTQTNYNFKALAEEKDGFLYFFPGWKWRSVLQFALILIVTGDKYIEKQK